MLSASRSTPRKARCAGRRSEWLPESCRCWWYIPIVKKAERNMYASSRRERRRRRKGRFMRKVSRKVARELAALARMPDDKIDLTDAPEVREWRGAVVGKFYRPIKKPVTIRVDADVLAWLKRQGRGYQTRINKLLREAMEGKRRRASVAEDEDQERFALGQEDLAL